VSKGGKLDLDRSEVALDAPIEKMSQHEREALLNRGCDTGTQVEPKPKEVVSIRHPTHRGVSDDQRSKLKRV